LIAKYRHEHEDDDDWKIMSKREDEEIDEFLKMPSWKQRNSELS
jgi:hypothetical protein